MGQAQSNTDPVSGLPTGATNPLASGTLPKGGDGRSIQVSQGFRHDDNTAGPSGTTGNNVSPYTLQGFAPLSLAVPPAALELRIRTNGKLIYGSGPNFNQAVAPMSSGVVVQRAVGQGHARLDDADGWRVLPVAGMDNVYFQSLDAACQLYFEFLVLSNL